ncbi:vitelline membrane outer layer protein 1 homolog [Daphnia carinata]|uniref:vitelline membrane outer layer protein 1 homolog n=1 Tax=Daphnia carinata TaxID=120202 RepID=UPI00257D4286|nr:vitelline membrane outer layer protein 1 homolog [Daphnia carinata]
MTSRLFSVSLMVSALVFGLVDSQIISVTNGEVEGDWGPMDSCPGVSRAVYYSTRNDANQGTDFTSLNAIQLTCDNGGGTIITSTEGLVGQMGPGRGCAAGAFLSAFQLKVQPNGVDADNTAANSIRFRCTDGVELASVGNQIGVFGEYSADCPNGICGIQTRVKPFDAATDNTALNDVRFECCA